MKILLGVLGAAGLFAATSSIAGEGYIGVSVGILGFEGDVNGNTDVLYTPASYKVFGGYELNEFFALDVAYFRALHDTERTQKTGFFATRSIPADVSADGFTIRAVGAFPTSDYFSILGSVGYWDGDAEASEPGSTVTIAGEGGGFTWGVGGKYRFGSASMRGEFEWLDRDDAMWMITVGVQINFGGK